MSDRYLIWSWEHFAWWSPGRAGYTESVQGAGRYSKAEAADIVADHIPPGEEVIVCEAWAARKGRPPENRCRHD